MRRAKDEQGWLSARVKKNKMFAMDVDGTLTDGCTYYSERGEELKRFSMKEVHVNVKDKLKKVSDIAFNYKVWLDVNVAYIGDDLSDIEVMKIVVLSFAPADAVEEVKKVAKVVTTRKGEKEQYVKQ